MKPIFSTIVVAVLCVLPLACQSRVASTQCGVAASTSPAAGTRPAAGFMPQADDSVGSGIRLLEAWIESQMAYRNWPGLSVGIVYDQELVWSRGFGFADLAANTPAGADTIYRVASNSKMFTSLAILQLRDAGKLQLDDPVAKHLSWFKLKNPDANNVPITLRHLLTHTAGLPRESPFPYWTDFNFPTREQLIGALKEQESVNAPFTKMKYSNLGMAILGEVVSAVSGEPFEQYIQRHVLTPLQMEGTSVVLSETHRKRLAVGYGRKMPDGLRAIAPFTDARATAPAAGVSSTVSDLAKLAALHFRTGPAGGSQILASSTLDEMRRPGWVYPTWTGGWGLGHQIIHTESRDLVGHGGWIRGYRTTFLISPREKVAVIVLSNCDDCPTQQIATKAFRWVAPGIVKAKEPAIPPAPDLAQWQKYVGKYRDAWGDSQVLIHNGKLIVIDPTDLDPLEDYATLTPAGPNTFKVQTANPFGDDGEMVVFEMDAGGKVQRVKFGQNYSYPIK